MMAQQNIQGMGAGWLHDAGAGWLRFAEPFQTLVARDTSEVRPVLERLEARCRAEGCYGVGYVAYEAAGAFDPAFKSHRPDAFPLAWFGLYRHVQAGAEAHPLRCGARGVAGAAPWVPSISRTDYESAIAIVRDYIRNGDTYQVNYSYRLLGQVQNPLAFWLQMLEAQGDHYGAFLHIPGWSLCSASPELFFEKTGNLLRTRPMKGTAPRGLWPEDDRQQAEALQASEKDRAENVMIVDMARNDLGRIARTGSVRTTDLFQVERYPTLWQMTSTVEARSDASLADVFAALFPAASITGAPKVRTMEIIRELEPLLRHVYTGTMGLVRPDGSAQFNVAIRTALVGDDGAAEYGVGGGIVWDSLQEREWQECEVKARVLNWRPPDFDLLETLLWTPDAGYYLLDLHLRRLGSSAEYFGRSLDWESLGERLQDLARGLSPQPHKVRLLVGQGGELDLRAEPLGTFSVADYTLSPAVGPIDKGNPFLYHKTTFREVYEEAQPRVAGVRDVLLYNASGELTESRIANVVLRLEGTLWTPPVRCGLLAGTKRESLLRDGVLQERVLTLEDAGRCEGLFLLNSVRGMWEARLVGSFRGC